MLSRRRRVTAGSSQPVELDRRQIYRTKIQTNVERLRIPANASTFASAETSIRATDPREFAPCAGHVDNRGPSPDEPGTVEDVPADGRRRPRRSREIPRNCSDEKCRRSDDIDTTSLIDQQQHNPHGEPPRPCENSRRRRRRNMRILDSPSIVQNSTTNPRCSNAPGDSENVIRTEEEPPRIFEPGVDDVRPADSGLPNVLDADVRADDCRTFVGESFEARPRLKNHEIQDFVREHKSSRRRDTMSHPGSSTYPPMTTGRGKTAWTQFTSPKYRYPILLGILLCTIMMVTDVTARQNHHRTCPGCPHQHVHTINRKAFPIETGPSDETEAAPSPDDLRLEAIKHQILTKLGLRSRPDVNKTLTTVPRHLALETLYRTEAQPVGYPGNSGGYHEGRRRDHHRHRGNDHEDSLSPSSSSSSSSSSYPSSATSDEQYYYAGEEYSYKTVDPELEENFQERGNDDSEVVMDDFYARTSEIITFAEPGCTLNGQPLLEFPRSNGDPVLEPLRIKKATLWARVELRHPHHYQQHRRGHGHLQNITLWVFRVSCGNVTHLRGKELGQHLDLVTSLSVNVNQLGWQKFDVTKVVSDWYSGHKSALTRHEKLTLLVDCSGCGRHVHVSTFGIQTPNVVESTTNAKGEQDPDRPFLVVRTDPAAVKRVKRLAIECSGAVKGQCCKQRFYVNFTQLGWDDWIIAPEGYYANYCKGDCTARHRTPDTFLNYYTHVIEEYRKIDRLAGMQPCCAPVKFSPVSLIYYGPDSNIIKRDLPKMMVDECGCP